jgi:hypothetical protein
MILIALVVLSSYSTPSVDGGLGWIGEQVVIGGA